MTSSLVLLTAELPAIVCHVTVQQGRACDMPLVIDVTLHAYTRQMHINILCRPF
jgi:hypothetical protein